MSDFDVQEGLEALRTEIQGDRWALRDELRAGFDRLGDKMESHSKDDVLQFSALAQRLTDVERTQKVIGGGLLTVIVTAVGAFITWVFGLFGVR